MAEIAALRLRYATFGERNQFPFRVRINQIRRYRNFDHPLMTSVGHMVSVIGENDRGNNKCTVNSRFRRQPQRGLMPLYHTIASKRDFELIIILNHYNLQLNFYRADITASITVKISNTSQNG